MAKHHSGKYYLQAAHKAGFNVKPAKGDHWKVTAPNGAQTIIPAHRELANGTECAIKKWFIRLGVVLAIICTLAHML